MALQQQITRHGDPINAVIQHNLVRPCEECPFRKGVRTGISWEGGKVPSNAQEFRQHFIARDVMRCHKTVYCRQPSACAGFKGAAAILLKDSMPELMDTYRKAVEVVQEKIDADDFDTSPQLRPIFK